MITVIVLAGGRNVRLGRNKAREAIGDKSLMERVIESVKPLSDRVLVVTSQEQLGSIAVEATEVQVDVYPGKGPLGGIYTGLLASATLHNLVVACDMPFLNPDLLRYMIGLSPAFDAIVPRLGTARLEPLCAVYSRNCLETMETAIKDDHLSLNRLLTTLHVRYIEKEECQRFDQQLMTFFNINYQADVDKATSLITEGRG